MGSTRLATLLNMVAQNPADTFARYGLAMEYAGAGEWEKAVEEFRALLAVNPNYAPAYFHGGRALEQLGRPEDARRLYEEGIAVTTRTGDLHTRGELQAALDLL